MRSRTQPRVTWQVVVELDRGIKYREDVSIKNIREFLRIAKQFNQWTNVDSKKKDTVINKYVFPYIFSKYPVNRIASISIKKV